MKARHLLYRYRIAAMVIAGSLVFALIHCLTYWLRFDGDLSAIEFRYASLTLGVAIAAKTASFLSFRVYQNWNRYASLHDLVTIAQATTVGSVLLIVTDYLFLEEYSIPRSIFLLDWGVTILAVGGLRSAFRLLREHYLAGRSASSHMPVFIVGANDAGEALLRAIRRSPKLQYNVVGFIAEDEACPKGAISGVPVVGNLPRVCELAGTYSVSEVLTTAGELSGQQIRGLIGAARNCGVSVKVLPSYEQLIHGQVDLRPREVSIQDLLHRDPVKLDVDGLHDWLDNQVVLVTGSAGSIGSEICRQLLQFSPKRLVLVDQSETGQFFLERELKRLAPHIDINVVVGDVLDGLRMQNLFVQSQPDVVFHAAAYKHVPLMEENPGEAVRNIALASRLVADLANRHAVKSFVMVSTDKAVNPSSVMGACKRVAELYIQALAAESSCQFVTVRFGNVLDSAGSVVPIFREQIAKGGPVSVTHEEMVRYFMTIPEASQLVLQAGMMGRGGEIFVLDMGEPVRIFDLAQDMIRLSGLRVGQDIEIEFSGVRPGEKLYEELHSTGEQHKNTSHPKIMVADAAARKLSDVRESVEQLTRCIPSGDEEVRLMLQQILPEYRRPEATPGDESRRAA